MKRKQTGRTNIINRTARYEYQIDETLEAGIVLTGAEVKSARLGRVQFGDSYVQIIGEEAVLVNAQISPYPFADNTDYQPTRTRKLLLTRKEIKTLAGKIQQKGWALVPLRMYLKRNMFKVELGLGRGKKLYEKREMKKRADIKREVEREVKARYRG